ncbi:HD domain-containing protein [Telmatospirillum sp. J64-1]|uniref:HD domain-containing protein n=1 Tax=Telmatospirillum sp. J64-1 TaxID=2502183 RepID=UPI00115EACAE|nr:HD domain-containing protein [Telmatospirillum sp. J64-1]
MTTDRLAAQIDFILEIDRLKLILRQNCLVTDRSHRENSAEHSWHLAVMAILLAEYADEPVDVTRVMKMLLIHDIVEVDAGDTFIYDEAGHADKEERERAAADRLFGMLPEDQGTELRALWDEFEASETADARFANALDRLQPVLLNTATEGERWRAKGVVAEQVLERNSRIGRSSQRLWELVRGRIERAVELGHLPRRHG